LADTLLAGTDRTTHDVFDELRLELVMGQFLDVTVAANRSMDAATSRRISLFKSAKYTVERPLHLGAAVAGGLDDLAPTLSAYGLPLGEAFQLRDDVLGAYGECAAIGKPVGDDFREAKPTQLVVHALDVARRDRDLSSLEVLGRLGDPSLRPDEVTAIQQVLESTGARAAVEQRIEQLLEESVDALAGSTIDAATRAELEELAAFCCRRDR
jgi:geranylgeranyl diphosphate synthase type I